MSGIKAAKTPMRPEFKKFPATPSAIQWDGWGSALKPANEPICVARKPLSEKSIVENVLKWGVGGLNIDGCRIGSNGTPGRFPANIIFDEEAGRMLDEMSGDNGGGKFKMHEDGEYSNAHNGYKRPNKSMYTHKNKNVVASYGDSGGASRFFYCAKSSRSERNAGLEGMEKKFIATIGGGIGEREHNENEPIDVILKTTTPPSSPSP